MTTAYPGCSKTAIECPQMDSSEDTKESESEQEKEMAKDSRKEKLSRTSGAANENSSEGQNDFESSNSGGPAEVPIINDNQASTSSNPLVAELQETSREYFRLLNAQNEETQKVTKIMTKAQLVAEIERLKEDNLELMDLLAVFIDSANSFAAAFSMLQDILNKK